MRKNIFLPGKTIASNQKITLRVYCDADWRNLFQLCSDDGFVSNHEQLFKRVYLKSYNNENNIIFSIISNSSNQFCGYCNVRCLNEAFPEIGIAVIEAFRNKGIGTDTLRLMMHAIKSETGIMEFSARVYEDNLPSLCVMQKLYAVKINTEASEYDQMMQRLNHIFSDKLDLLLSKNGIENTDKRKIAVFHLKAPLAL